MEHFADRLCAAVRSKGNPLCVGLDPRWESLPEPIRQRHGLESLDAVAAAYEEFCSRVLEIVAPLVAVVKPQSAFFEACGPEGMAVLQRLLRRARELGLLTILDAKRNDIASTGQAYADAAFGGTRIATKTFPVWQADALTINPYLGADAIEPFVQSARRSGGGVFVLLKTSNPGGADFQDLTLAPEAGERAPHKLYHRVGETIRSWALQNLGLCDLGDVGAVVGATYPEEMVWLRQQLPEVVFLVPGFGAQGGSAADAAAAFRPDGLGAIVNSSRGILFPYPPSETDWEAKVANATRQAAAALTSALATR